MSGRATQKRQLDEDSDARNIERPIDDDADGDGELAEWAGDLRASGNRGHFGSSVEKN